MRYNSFIFILLFGISILSSCINTDITAEEPATIAPKVSPVHAIQPKALLPGGSLFTALTEGGRDTILGKIRSTGMKTKCTMWVWSLKTWNVCE